MKRTKKLLVGLLATLSVLFGSLGLAACDEAESSSGAGEATEIEKAYAQYVVYAETQGQTPLSYEEWFASIKGEKGDKGDTGAQGEKGDTGAQGEKGEKGDTGAQGEKGEKGDTGAQGVGIEKVEYDENGDLKITFTDGTTQTIVMPASESGSLIDKGATEGLHYQKIPEKEEYRVIGLGLAAETDIVISSTYKGLPVTEIDEYAFYTAYNDNNIRNLTSLTIPDSVISIGEWAFANCSSLTSVTIGNSVNSIGNSAFENCSSLTSVHITDIEAWCKISGLGNLMTSYGAISKNLYLNKNLVTELEISDSVTSIGACAFAYCDSLTSVTIGNGVTSIGSYAFSRCENLTSITFNGTKAQWNAVEKGNYWNNNVPATKVVCSDGEVEL